MYSLELLNFFSSFFVVLFGWAPIGKYLRECNVNISFDNKDAVKIIQSTAKSIPFLEALEALWQRDIKPRINTRDEYKRRQLTIKF